MYIQSYQIHNVLNVYRRQLSQIKPDQVQQTGSQHAKADSVRISAEGKNQSIMQKVTDNVLKKITNLDPGSVDHQKMSDQDRQIGNQPDAIERDSRFVFKTLGGDNQKETRSIAIDDSQVLMNRLNELAQAAVNRNAD
jgi:hypothetical protein